MLDMGSRFLQAVHHEVEYGTKFILRDGPVSRPLLRKLSAHDRLSRDDLDLQARSNLCRTVAIARRNIPFYRDIGRAVSETNVEEVLRTQFPIIDREDLLQQRPLLYPNRGKTTWLTIVGETGGTTGAPLQVIRDLRSVVFENAFLKRHWSWSGFQIGMRRAILRGDMAVPAAQRQPPFWRLDRYSQQLVFSSLHLSAATAGFFIQKLREYRPYLLQAYPSRAYELAVYLAERDEYLDIPFVYTGSEPLHAYQRIAIEERLRTKVMDFYGMAERTALATECEFGSLHVNTDYSYMEIVDENGSPTDDYGYVVGTTFHNHLMPLIRYKISDRTRWKPGACACGRPYPMIERVSGRAEDAIYGSRGNDIGPSLYRMLKGVGHIRQCQTAQVGENRLEIRIVPAPGYTQRETKKLLGNLKAYVDPEINASVVLANEIPRTQRGKHRWVVNEYRDGYRER